jgi:hypothetical protein
MMVPVVTMLLTIRRDGHHERTPVCLCGSPIGSAPKTLTTDPEDHVIRAQCESVTIDREALAVDYQLHIVTAARDG